MKLNLHLAAATFIIAMASCSKIDNNQETVVPEPNPGQLKGHEISATISQTKTSLNSAMKVVWSEGDEITVFGSSNTKGAVYATENEGAVTAVFAPKGDASAVNDQQRYAVYPASAVASELADGKIGINFGTLASQNYIAELSETSNISKLPMFTSSAGREFVFSNLFGGIALQLNEYQNIDIMVTSVEVTGGDNEQIGGTGYVNVGDGTVTLSKGTENTKMAVTSKGIHINSAGDMTASSGIVVFLPATTYSKGLKFKITDSEGRVYEKAAPNAITVQPGVVTPLSSLNLSIYYGTANCYVASGEQTLEIDITPYYTFSDRFTYDGNKVTDTSGNVKGAPVGASIVWQAAELASIGSDVIASTSVSGTKLTVKTTGVKGNAVIAVKDNTGATVWSYHIWVSEVNDLNAFDGTTIIDRHLGATSTTIDSKDAFGLFYQWGRKDPFDRKLDNSKTSSKAEGELKAYSSLCSANVKWTAKSEENATIGYTIAHPDEFLYTVGGGTSVDWHATQINNLWGHNGDGDVKTFYDPCPEGYRVVSSSFISLIKDNNAADKTGCAANNGYIMNIGEGVTSYFPLTGVLGLVNTGAKPESARIGTLQLVDFRGYVWVNSALGDGHAEGLYYNNATIGPLTSKYGAELGHAVRCQKL